MFNHLSLCFYSESKNTLYLVQGAFTKKGSSTSLLTCMDANDLESNFICIYIVIIPEPACWRFYIKWKIHWGDKLSCCPSLTYSTRAGSQSKVVMVCKVILSLTAKMVIFLVVTCWEFRLEAIITYSLYLLCLLSHNAEL